MPVLANVPDRWRCLFAAALYTGMRKGELLGLRKEDVDLGARLITIRRSHDRDTTKGGHADAVPIAAELAPYLEVAMAASKTELVFPGRDGRLLSRRVQLEQVLRRALRRANILTGYRHTCRRKGCGHVEQAPDGEIRWCPKYRMKLWPVGQVRPIRFHHIRHTTASLLMMAGADLPAVQRIMRHTDPRITTEFYGHLAPGYLCNAIDRLAFEGTPSDPTGPIPEFAAPLLQTRKTGARQPSDDSEEPPRLRYLSGSGREDSNLRHPAPKSAGPDRSRWQWFTSIRRSLGLPRRRFQRFAAGSNVFESFAPILLPAARFPATARFLSTDAPAQRGYPASPRPVTETARRRERRCRSRFARPAR